MTNFARKVTLSFNIKENITNVSSKKGKISLKVTVVFYIYFNIPRSKFVLFIKQKLYPVVSEIGFLLYSINANVQFILTLTTLVPTQES